MNNPFARLGALFNREPAALMYGLSAALIPILTSWLHWDTRQSAAGAAIMVALSSMVSAFQARPVSTPILIGGATAITTALAAWHLKIPAADMAYVSSLITVLVGSHMRTNLTPVVTLRPPAPKA